MRAPAPSCVFDVNHVCMCVSICVLYPCLISDITPQVSSEALGIALSILCDLTAYTPAHNGPERDNVPKLDVHDSSCSWKTPPEKNSKEMQLQAEVNENLLNH